MQILELEEPIAQMKIIHVAGTKGKVCIILVIFHIPLVTCECRKNCKLFGLECRWLMTSVKIATFIVNIFEVTNFFLVV